MNEKVKKIEEKRKKCGKKWRKWTKNRQIRTKNDERNGQKIYKSDRKNSPKMG